MTSINTVAIVGAGGNVGKAVLPVFLGSSLKVTVITREDSKSTFPSEVKVVKTDFSPSSLATALQGQDAVLCLLGTAALAHETSLIDAAVTAGVKWFVPSEFGHDTTDDKVTGLLPLFKGKTKVIDHLRTKESSGLSWTAIITGLLYDWGLVYGILGFDIKARTATIWDEGKTPFCTTNLNAVALALLHLFTDPSALAAAQNKHVFISSFTTTQSETLAALEKVTGEKWTVDKVSSAEVKADAQERLSKGDFSAAVKLLQYIALGEDALSGWEKKAAEGNKLLLADHKETVLESVTKVVEKVKGDAS